MYYDLVAFADVYKIQFTTKSDSSPLSGTSQINQSSSNNLSCYQLPKRKFPNFSGVITEWQGFEDLFQSILSHAPELSNIERFEYLKTSLTGEALSIISHLPLSEANYNSAWELLRTRYGNKRDLARVHLNALLSPHVVKCDDAVSIKNLLNCILEHTAALDNLGFTTRSWSPMLIHLFEKALDYELRTRWELVVGDKHLPQNRDFTDFLRSHIRSAEVCSSHKPKSNQQGLQLSAKNRYGYFQKVLSATTNLQNTSCPVCNKVHSIRKCPLFLEKSAKERFQLVKGHHLCINCLSHGHSSVNCTSKYKCQTCSKLHHTMLHFASAPLIPQPTPKTTTCHTEAGSSTISLLVRGQPTKVILLSTTLLEVRSSNGIRHTLRALLDSGAQASFITEKSARSCVILSFVNCHYFLFQLSICVRAFCEECLSTYCLNGGLSKILNQTNKSRIHNVVLDGCAQIEWARYRSELTLIETIDIPRRITHNLACSVQLHAFSDSSEMGYAAAVYLRVSTQTSVHCQLIMGKSKVSPLKRSTIPRLELCGAVLAAKILRLIATTYADHLEINELHAWTDSMTTLFWIRSSPHRWATFVANRTSQIHDLTPPSIWRYVPTQHNPVDCASRGLLPSALVNHPLWWNGPAFLLESSDK